MVRGRKETGAHRAGIVHEGKKARSPVEDTWDPANAEEDPYRDLRAPGEDPSDPASDDYVWPEYEEENDD
nr:hypothetical protein [uncultured Methanoregula sp.]